MLHAVITSKGQTTIPKPIREFLHLHSGDQIDFIIEGKDRVIIRPSTMEVHHIKGLLKRKDGKKLTLEQMDEAIAKGAKGEK